jgi:hypothetical protein
MKKQCKVCGAPIVSTWKSSNLRYCPSHRPPPRSDRKKYAVENGVRGVHVRQPGCALWDRYSKRDFEYYLEAGAFPKGTEYILNGDPGMV